MTSSINKRTFLSVPLKAGGAIMAYYLLTSLAPLCGEIYSAVWERILELFGHNQDYLFVIGTMGSLGIPYWTLILLFMSLDLLGKPKFLLQYKIQENINAPVNWRTYMKCVKVVSINQFISIIIVLLMHPIMKWRKIPYMTDDLPSLSTFAAHIIFFVFVEETMFYYLHRTFHHPFLYKHIHKIHHEWTAPICMAVVYVHPLEHIIVNTIPIMASPILLGSHLSTTWIYYVSATMVATIHHSGYHFPFIPSAEFHDYHHAKFTQCYGVLGILDWFHKTDHLYRQSKKFQNDRMYFTLEPIWRK